MLRVGFGEDYGQEQFKLLEISDPRLLAAIKAGDQLVIKGDPNDEAMLIGNQAGCFKLREACISNQLIWLNGQAQVQCLAHGYLEAVPTKGRIERLAPLLRAAPLTTANLQAPVSEALLLPRLLADTQASEVEIKLALERLEAFEWHGAWRIFSHELLVELAQSVLRDSLADECHPELLPIAQRLFYPAGQPDWQRVTRILLEEELKNGRDLLWRPFQERWNARYAQLNALCERDLYGLAWFDEHPASNDYRLVYLPSHSLPGDLGARLTRLFRERPRWPHEELMVYLSQVGEPEEQLTAFFLKNCRLMTDAQGRKWVTPMVPL